MRTYILTKHGVSIHALLAECDLTHVDVNGKKVKFQSTHSLRSATMENYHMEREVEVSIHALLAECD